MFCYIQEVGASCGRTHPTGAGYMQWCQKFEYAYNHWFVKSTEYITGCVLCSPGNFSLFRGEALMSDNVMTTYATVSTKPFHRIQYDQGEDRWLCSLLLQEGWGVEYLAASGKKNDFSLHQKIRVTCMTLSFCQIAGW